MIRSKIIILNDHFGGAYYWLTAFYYIYLSPFLPIEMLPRSSNSVKF